ncbi:type III-B CRISPR module-associated protein Cmr5 [bacterium]|nr:type III-B CRISPR module-associated protein Cmr5 [bacterium]
MRTTAQQRAAFSLGQLEKLPCKREDFKNFAAGLPSMILQNGFGQALAFLAAKGSKEQSGQIRFKTEDKHYAALKIILAWLVDRKLLTSEDEKKQIMQISNMEQMTYLRAQRETLAMLEWLKRYANAALFTEAGS